MLEIWCLRIAERQTASKQLQPDHAQNPVQVQSCKDRDFLRSQLTTSITCILKKLSLTSVRVFTGRYCSLRCSVWNREGGPHTHLHPPSTRLAPFLTPWGTRFTQLAAHTTRNTAFSQNMSAQTNHLLLLHRVRLVQRKTMIRQGTVP
jgi:hypothetical protein